MASFDAAVACLTGAYTSFITQSATKLALKMQGVIASFTDPIDALASTNITQLTKDVSNISSGNVTGKLVSIGEAIIINKVKRELNSILEDVIQRNPGVGDAIQRITNMTEAVYGIISLAVMLRKEAPYSAIVEIIEELNEMLDAKEQSLTSMQAHLVQLNNVIQSAVDNPIDTATLVKDDYELASSKLGTAVNSLVALESSMINSRAIFVQKELDGAIQNIRAAEALISPDTDVNVLDVAKAAANGALPTQYLDEAQRKLSVYSIIPLSLQIECELHAVERNTRRINNYLAQLENVVPSYEEAAESTAMKSFRTKLVTQLRIRTQRLRDDIDKALTKANLSTIGIHSLSWCARLESILDMVPRVQNQLAVGSDDAERLASMEEEADQVLEALSEINSQNVSGGIESTIALSSQVSTLVAQGKNIMTLMGENKIGNYDIETFKNTSYTVTKSGDSAISESLEAITEIKSALSLFNTKPESDQLLTDMLQLLELLGMDRAKDLLKLGKFKDFLNTTIDDASYIGLAIKCLVDVEAVIEDTITLETVTKLRETLESQRVSELAAAFDILDSGKNAAVLEIQNALAEGQSNLERVQRIVTELKSLASKAGETVNEISEAADGLEDALGEIATSPGGALRDAIDELDVNALQGGCRGQLRF
jgi:hypothetical protein